MLHQDTVKNLQDGGLLPAVQVVMKNINTDSIYSPLSLKTNQIDYILNDTPINFIKDKKVKQLVYTDRSLFNFNFMLNELLDTKILFIDTETTGLKPTKQPVQITAILTDCYLNIIEYKNFFLHRTDIDPEALSIHRLTPEFLKENETPKNEIFKFFEDLDIPENKIIVTGYNVSFDIETIANLYYTNGVTMPSYFDTTFCLYRSDTIAPKLYPQLRSKKLVNIINVLNLDNGIRNLTQKLFNISPNSHDARYDTVATVLLLREFYKSQKVDLQWDS